MTGLYSASGLILLSKVVRVVDYIMVYDEFMNHHEPFLYAFDTVPMLGVTVVMSVIYAPFLFAQRAGEEHSEAAAELQPRTPK